jgi:hypothetical protein
MTAVLQDATLIQVFFQHEETKSTKVYEKGIFSSCSSCLRVETLLFRKSWCASQVR